MDRKFSIWIVKTETYWHTGMVVGELARSLQQAFKELGYKETPIVDDPADIKGWAVVLCTNFLKDLAGPLPPNLILYNLEQVQQDSRWMTADHLDIFREYPLWDYSELNISNLKTVGINHAVLCKIGYMPVLSHIPPAAEDIDILFYGTVNDRRKVVLDELKQLGANVFVAEGIYGEELNKLIARAKIVLNVHYYEAKVFEIVRVSFLLANKKCVVSENGTDKSLEEPLYNGIEFTGYKNLVKSCMNLLEQPERRSVLAQKGFESFKQISQTEALREVLSHTKGLE